MNLSNEARRFIKHIDRYGQDRYLTYPYAVEGPEISLLDRTVWEFRRYCTRHSDEREIKQIEDAIGEPPGRFPPSIPGLLESIIDSTDHPARSYLLWLNAYFGDGDHIAGECTNGYLGFQGVNSFLSRYPESQYPDLYMELRKLIKLPKDAGDQVLPEKHRSSTDD